jgi:predicted anti-sigma-YlaC factor YlaD
MGMNHLTDEQIQDYLDGNSAVNTEEIESHLQSCEACRTELARYRSLSTALSEDVGFELEPNFAADVVASLEEEGAERFFYKVAKVILWATGIFAAIAVLIRFTNIEDTFSGFTAAGKQGESAFKGFYLTIKQAIESSGIDIRLVLMIALVILGIFLIDRLIMRTRKNITSTSLI